MRLLIRVAKNRTFRVTTFFIVIKLAGTVIGMPMTLWFAQVWSISFIEHQNNIFQTWRHGSGLCSRYDENLRAFPIVMSAGRYNYYSLQPIPPSYWKSIRLQARFSNRAHTSQHFCFLPSAIRPSWWALCLVPEQKQWRHIVCEVEVILRYNSEERHWHLRYLRT